MTLIKNNYYINKNEKEETEESRESCDCKESEFDIQLSLNGIYNYIYNGIIAPKKLSAKRKK